MGTAGSLCVQLQSWGEYTHLCCRNFSDANQDDYH